MIEYATYVAITFEFLKKGERNDTFTQLDTDHSFLSLARIWAATVLRIRSYPGANNDTLVSAVQRNNRIQHVTSAQMSNALRDTVSTIGEETLGFKSTEIGTHSLRSGAAMDMFLGECPV